MAYEKLDQISHILKRNDMYIGSAKNMTDEEWIFDDNQIIKKEISYNPGFLRIFVEALSNVIDNVWRSQEESIVMDKINITIEDDMISVTNDGRGIPFTNYKDSDILIPELIFGHLLTSTNYNDQEERLTSGRNGLGCKCLDFYTKVPLFNGNIKYAKDIKVGDVLIGDDGNSRNVLSTITGKGKMYEVIQNRGENYKVNDEHILTLHMPDHKVIFWNTYGWSLLWWNNEDKKIHNKFIKATDEIMITCDECGLLHRGDNWKRHYRRQHPNIQIPLKPRKPPNNTPDMKDDNVIKALNNIQEFANTIDDNNVFDISIKDYLKLPKTVQSRLAGVRGECVNWEYREVELDPYILGLWLGYGMSRGYGYACDGDKDYQLIDCLREWGNKNDANIRQIKGNKYYYGISSIDNYGKMGYAPLKKLLSQYNLINNKHIPNDYLVNNREVRLNVLAGIIDTDGTVCRDGSRVVISQSWKHERLINDILYLARSLGFCCLLTSKMASYKLLDGEQKQSKTFVINISGNIDDIPTKLPRKKCQTTKRQNTDKSTGQIKIQEIENTEFVGISIDGNERFVLDDFTVTHNCTNVFSKKFEIELHNKDSQQIYKQKWENNMRKCHKPTIKSKAIKHNLVSIKFWPDYERFGLEGMTSNIMSLFYKYCVDTAMITKLPVVLNKDKIRIKQFSDYVKMYPINSKECIVLEKKEDMDVVLCSSDNGYQEIAFTNGVFNRQGGVHADTVINEICRALLPKINSKLKSTLTVKDLKPHFTIFLNCKLVNPSFNNQSKDRLMSPNIKYKFDSKYVANILKWEFVEKMKENIQMKELKTIKKMERKRVRIEGYDPANLCGTKRSRECTLILSEGLSSKSYGINGMNIGIDGKKGRDYFGILPLRGVLMNARNATLQSVMNNKEIMNIASILNLKYNQENKIEDLNYGKLLILVDSDKDGIHIASLILNFIDVLYPSLLQQEFVYMMLTPIAKINDNVFYNEYDYVSFLKTHESKNLKIKYYKGLGTSSAQEIKETFGKRIVKFVLDDDAKHHLNKVFHQKFADQRKEWLANYDIQSYIPIQDECLISNYINHELIKFSIYDCERNIPNLFDGLKISQRKILYSVMKRNLHYKNKSMKIAQLGGYVAEVSNYHHGENCLFDTITKMTQSFVGTNNYPLLYPDGNCGSRNNLGKDAANARYIYTRMQEYTPHIFMKEDDSNLNYQYEDNEYVEPEFYVPILPMILVNGCQTAIGTGWSSTLPAFNVKDILEYINRWLDNKDQDSEIPFVDIEIKPYWNHFKGEIQKVNDVKYTSRGIFKVDSKGRYIIEEIPVYISIDKYKEFLESLVDDKHIKNFKNYSTTNNIHFEFNLCGNFEATHESLKLVNTINLTNMVLFTKNKRLHKFNSIFEIMETFCNERYDRYKIRKKHMIRKLKKQISILENKHRFLHLILSNEIILNKYQDNEDIYKLLSSLDFMNDDDGKFSYMLNIPIRGMTKTRLMELEQSIKNSKKELCDLEHTTVTNLWRNDLKILVDLL